MQYPPGYRSLPWSFAFVCALWFAFECLDQFVAPAGQSLEQRLIYSLRQIEHPGRMIGPPSLEEAMRDFSALGGYAVLITTTVCFSVFARAELGREMLRFFVMTVTSGFAAGVLFKQLIRRDRPALVPHLSHVSGNTSFPSSHAMMSVVVFITIGLLLSQLSRSRALRHVLVGLPFLIAFLVGVSRVCMGVHFPTDVLGGWALGLLWVWGAFAIRGRFLAR